MSHICRAQPSPPRPLLTQLLSAVPWLAGCGRDPCQHPREAVESLCCLQGPQPGVRAGPGHLPQLPRQGCSQPAAVAALQGVSQGSEHSLHVSSGGVAAHEADAQDLRGEGWASVPRRCREGWGTHSQE